jgi:DNA-binding transcriptional ArsR family regulator
LRARRRAGMRGLRRFDNDNGEQGRFALNDDLDDVWKALSDPTRRQILDLLRDGSKRTTDLVAAFPHLSRFGVMKHLDVLRKASLVVAREQGRECYNAINVVPIRRIYERWVSKFEGSWANVLLRVKDRAEDKSAKRKDA